MSWSSDPATLEEKLLTTQEEGVAQRMVAARMQKEVDAAYARGKAEASAATEGDRAAIALVPLGASVKATEREGEELATLRGECEALRALGLAADKRHAEEVALLKARIVKLERDLARYGHRAPNHAQSGVTDEAAVEDTAAVMRRLASAEDAEALLARFASEEDAEALLKRLASEEDAEALLKRLASGAPSLEPRTHKGVMLA
jgi:hypothetical protein